MSANLKKVLADMGSELVCKHGFLPALSVGRKGKASTKPIQEFMDWVNATPKAQQVLLELGIEWPVIKDSRRGENRTCYKLTTDVLRELSYKPPVCCGTTVEYVGLTAIPGIVECKTLHAPDDDTFLVPWDSLGPLDG